MITTGKLDPTELVSETIDIQQIPDSLEAISDFSTMGIPVVNNFTAWWDR